MTATDRADPGSRAEARFERARSRDRNGRLAIAWTLIASGVAAPFAAEVAAADPGAAVGGVAAGLLLVTLAVAVWPQEWSTAEERHRRLEWIWREIRTDADAHQPWERYGAWAEPAKGRVELSLIRCEPAARRFGGAPSPYGRRVRRRIAPDEVATAAEAMEKLRAEAAELELAARQRHHDELGEAERRAHDELMRGIDEAAEAYQREADERARRELAEQDAAERAAEAEALARALRRP